MEQKKSLLIVDVQNDFCPGGTLPVPEGDKIIPVLNKYIKIFSRNQLPVFASRDWHPAETKHFRQFGGQWPEHCVQNTKGARFHPKLELPKETIIISKGIDSQQDSYSAFQAEDANGRDFCNLLKLFAVETLFVGGLATDYCVRASVVDALKKGFRAVLLEDAVKGVDLNPADSGEAIKEMIMAGAKLITFEKLEKMLKIVKG